MKVQISDKRFSLNTTQKLHINGKPLVKMSILNRGACCITQPVQILSLHREILTRYNRLLDANRTVLQSYNNN